MIGALFHSVSRCVQFCREQREQTPGRAVRADLGWFSKACEGRKEKQPAMGLSTDKNTNKMKVHFGNENYIYF